RPDPSHLTDFYFCISLGGVLGGCFNALLAPLIFTTILEYPLMLGAACLLRPQLADPFRAGEGAPVPGALPKRTIQLAASLTAGVLLLTLLLTIDRAACSGRLTGNALVRWVSGLDFARGRVSPGIFVVAARAALPAVILACLLPFRGSLRFALAALALLLGSQLIGMEGTVFLRHRSFFGVATIYAD